MFCHIIIANGSSIVYEYTADGSKVRTTHTINNHFTSTVYCGNAIYENGSLKMLLNEAGKVDEVNDYYPFGGLMSSSSSSVQPYMYNGKELDRKSGLDWYDYRTRMYDYDTALSRWYVMDPMAEKYYGWSLHICCGNNPILCIDPGNSCKCNTATSI